MFGIISRWARRTKTRRPRTRLCIEHLETRACPAAPQITLDVTMISERYVQLSGTVQDEDPTTVAVSFSGVVQDQAFPDANGNYSLLAEASGLGTVYADAIDGEQLASNTASAETVSFAPSITLDVTYGAGRTITLSGQVTDETPGNRMVVFSGMVDNYAFTEPDGTFSLTTADAFGLGPVQAVTEDVWGLASNVAEVTLASAVPTVGFSVTYGTGRTVTLSGQVVDESPTGMQVTFSGVINDAVFPDAAGYFSLTIEAAQLGLIQASTEDAWGQQSSTAEATLSSNAPVILDFEAIQGEGNLWTFRGRVEDESAPGLTVQFGGLTSLAGLSATVDGDGWFTFSVQLGEEEEGTATAQSFDWWGLESNIAEAAVLGS